MSDLLSSLDALLRTSLDHFVEEAAAADAQRRGQESEQEVDFFKFVASLICR